jgi:hypothetical protein
MSAWDLENSKENLDQIERLDHEVSELLNSRQRHHPTRKAAFG